MTELTLAVDDAIPAATRDEVVGALRRLALPELAGVCRVERLAGGASNENFLVSAQADDFVLRLAAADVERFGIDRPRGLQAHRRAAEVGIAPPLLGALVGEGHCVTPFLPGQVLDSSLLREDSVLESCVESLLVVHHAGSIDGRFSAFEDTRRYLGIADREGLRLPDDIDAMRSAADQVEAAFDSAPIPELLCHNDVQLQNFIIDGTKAWLLDWEYAGMGNIYFDLAMLDSNGELNDDERERMLRSYFQVVRECDRARIRLMRFMSALREAGWSVIAEPVLRGTGWDYQAWADRFFGKTRASIASAQFARDLDSARGQPDDDTVFTRAAERAVRGRGEGRA